MHWIVDRIEEDIAVIETEDGNFNVPMWALPQGISEGSVISVAIDNSEEMARKNRIKKKMNRLFRD